jgi:ubiquinol oxidase
MTILVAGLLLVAMAIILENTDEWKARRLSSISKPKFVEGFMVNQPSSNNRLHHFMALTRGCAFYPPKLNSARLAQAQGLENPTATHNESTAKVMNGTRQTLLSLIERQRKDLEASERLLSILDDEGNVFWQSDSHNINKKGRPLGNITLSRLAGFDYGFRSRSEGPPSGFSSLDPFSHEYNATGGKLDHTGPPGNFLKLSVEQFRRNWQAIQGEYGDEEKKVVNPIQSDYRDILQRLTLNSSAIWEREYANGPIVAPLVIKVPYLVLCFMLDAVFEGRYVPSRFFLLETVARMPYFSYISMLHLYETIGFWRRSAETKRIHFAQELNEYHHLLIMESLGGDQEWWVRALAQHAAVVYYFVLCFLWAASPSLSYRFSELLEGHAVNTYGQFLDENEDLLKLLPPPIPAVNYYTIGASDPLYAEFQTKAAAQGLKVRRRRTIKMQCTGIQVHPLTPYTFSLLNRFELPALACGLCTMCSVLFARTRTTMWAPCIHA